MRRLRGAVSSASGAVMRHHVVLTAVAAARVPHAVLPVAALPLLHHLAAPGCPRQPRPRPGQCAGRDGEGLEVQLWHVRVYVQNEGQGKRRLSRVSSTIQSPRPALAHDLAHVVICRQILLRGCVGLMWKYINYKIFDRRYNIFVNSARTKRTFTPILVAMLPSISYKCDW